MSGLGFKVSAHSDSPGEAVGVSTDEVIPRAEHV